jgi:SAM-dependent methyltransferase
MDEVNQVVYRRPTVTREYADSRGLTGAEALSLMLVLARFPHERVLDILDIGVGTGRTIPFLVPLARRYECIDFSPVMVEHVRSHFPDVSVHQCDMRDLKPFSSSTFDLVFGPQNVIDAVSAEDRLQVLAEIHRVLRPGGILVFSTHNRDHSPETRGPRLKRSRNPVTQAMNAVTLLRQWKNYLPLRHLEREEEEHSLRFDGGHDYSLIHYYIDARHQRAQLERAGYRPLMTIDSSPRVLSPDETSSDSSLHYVAQRIP